MDALARALERGPEAGRRRPRLQRARHGQPGRRDRPAGARRRARSSLVDGAQAAPKLPLDVGRARRRLLRASPATSCTGRPGSASSTAGASLLEAMGPFEGGGSMIRKVDRGRDHLGRRTREVRGGDAADRRGDRAGRRDRMAGRARTRRRARPRGRPRRYALERLAEVPGLRVFGPPAGRGPRRHRLLRARRRPRPRRVRDPRPPRGRRASRPPLRPGPDGAPRRRRRPRGPASPSTTLARRSTG